MARAADGHHAGPALERGGNASGRAGAGGWAGADGPDGAGARGGPGPAGQQSGKRSKSRSWWVELPILLAFALILALLIKTFVVQAFFIPSSSMENTLDIVQSMAQVGSFDAPALGAGAKSWGQRLTRAVGKATAMDVILSGRQLGAREALAAGLVARVVAREAWLEEAKRVAREIASKGPVATRLAKEAVDRAHETTLGLGLEYERRALYLAFASEDAKEGLEAFVEKRKPDFKGR